MEDTKIWALISPFILKLGIKPGGKWSSVVPKLITAYPDLDALERKRVRLALHMLGYVGAAESLDPQNAPAAEASGFTCPVVRLNVVSPCNVDSCRYHVGKTDIFNCLLIAAEKAEAARQAKNGQETKTNELKPAQISEIFGLPIVDIEEIRVRALRKMRASSVSVAREQRELQEEFTFIKNNKLCCACEKRVRGVFYEEDGFVFCSSTCLEQQSPIEVKLEAKFGTAASKVVKWATSRYDNKETAAQALGCSPSTLQKLQKRKET